VTIPLALALALILLFAPGTQSETIMKLRDGRVMRLREAPRIAGGRIVFTTIDGRTYSLAENEVLSIGADPTPSPTPRQMNPLDSHNLGAIARQERQKTGRKAEVAVRPTATPKPETAPKPPKRPRLPRRTPTPRPAN
jgi:CRP-like cAMP-binding protein